MLLLNTMSFRKLSRYDLDTSACNQAFDELLAREVSGVIIFDAPYRTSTHPSSQRCLELPWVSKIGAYEQDRATELGGTMHMPDMPAHVDPHPIDSLKIHVTTAGLTAVKFALGVPIELLDEHNEVSEAILIAEGIETDEAELRPGDAVCFYGSTTLHQFTSVGPTPRESFINSYQK